MFRVFKVEDKSNSHTTNFEVIEDLSFFHRSDPVYCFDVHDDFPEDDQIGNINSDFYRFIKNIKLGLLLVRNMFQSNSTTKAFS